MFNTTVIEALAAADVPAFYDEDQSLLIAHAADVPQDRAPLGEHVVIQPRDRDGGGYFAVAWEPDGLADYLEIADVYETSGTDVDLCARAVAEWFTTPRPSAGGVLLVALAEWGITAHTDGIGMSYAIPVDPSTPEADIRNRPHLSVGDRNPSVEHVPAAHTGWTLFLHDENGEPVGDPLYISGDGGPVDCDRDSAAVAEAIADFLTSPAH
ncbi:hypothetical protein [Streptomyces sp. NRRL S-920]|uniref:hypothetical protein n=1 Tax=Streptomyces sp. NRRL S-920 TaxID=1463921 RepID=UPI00068A51FA|nr:hypothetical protein [Streptomyces sp. NRRL S-920]